MAENDPSDGAGKDREPEIAAADLLFRDDPVKKPSKPAVDPAHVGESGEVFDLAPPLTSEPEPTGSAPAPIPARPKPADRPRVAAPRPVAEPTREDPRDLVEEVWSRQGEWGPTLLLLAAWLIGLAVFLFFAIGILPYGLTFLALLIGGAGAFLISYPILITLERPIRMTPEQAVRDYYGACRITCLITEGCGYCSAREAGPRPPSARSRGSRPTGPSGCGSSREARPGR